MESNIDIERQLRDAISGSGQSLNQLGEAAGVNDAQLSRFMRGQRTLTLETVGRLCRILGLQFCPADEHQPQPEAEPPAPAGKKARKKKGE